MSVGSGAVTLQAVEPPCCINNCPVKLNRINFNKWRTNLENSVLSFFSNETIKTTSKLHQKFKKILINSPEGLAKIPEPIMVPAMKDMPPNKPTSLCNLTSSSFLSVLVSAIKEQPKQSETSSTRLS